MGRRRAEPERGGRGETKFRGVRAAVVVEPDEESPGHVRVRVFVDPPPSGYHREVWSAPVRAPREGAS